MVDYECWGCKNPIKEGYVIVGRSGMPGDSPKVVLHAGSLREDTDHRRIMKERLENKDSCVAKYVSRDSDNDLIGPIIVPFYKLESMVGEQ